MKKIFFMISLLISGYSFADLIGPYAGGGFGYGIQTLSNNGYGITANSGALTAFLGYQFANWVGAEAGWTYIAQSSDWNNLGAPSTTIYSLTVTPGFMLPGTPVSVYTRLGIDFVSANFNSSWDNQVFSQLTPNLEWGLGVKANIPSTPIFLRAEYVNYGQAFINNNFSVVNEPSALMVNAGYIF